jgi:hypothetical protein
MATNDFLPYATDAAANVISQATWAAGTLSQSQTRAVGFLGGLIAEAEEVNKIWRQSQFAASALAQFISDTLAENVLDNGVIATFQDQLKRAIYKTAGRQKVISGTANLYVSATAGSDSNDGLTSITPFLSLQKAWDTLALNYDLDGNNAIIHAAPGTYASFIAWGPVIGARDASSVLLQGDTTTPGNIIIAAFSDNSIIANQAQLTVKGVSVEATGATAANGYGLVAFGGSAEIVFDRINFGACSNAHWGAIRGHISCESSGSYTIQGNANTHVFAASQGSAEFDSASVQILGGPVFNLAFAATANIGLINSLGSSFAGACYGPRYSAVSNGVINTNGAGGTYFPGSVAGSLSTGGQYI